MVETPKALELAKEKGLDLIEIAPKAKPPVCRIMDFGKYQYQQSKKEREQKTKQKQTETKSVRVSPRAGSHDLQFKVRQVEKFLNKENKVKIDMMLKGREKALFNTAKDKLNEFINSIGLEIELDQEIKRQPRGFSIVIRKKYGKKTKDQ